MTDETRPLTLSDLCGTAWRLLRILLSLDRDRADRVYNTLGHRHRMTDRNGYINLGYWERAQDLDQASKELALLLGREAGLCAEDEVLDAGFGFGDQDLLWARHFGPARITGVNVTAAHVASACRIVTEAGLDGRIELRLGDATRTGLEAGSFTKVLALESAFHFRTREAFFEEAFRLLRPGGRLALADLALRAGHRASTRARLGLGFGCLAWQIPSINLYDARVYEANLRRVGFVDVEIRSIAECVFGPFIAFQRPRFDQPAFRRRYHPLIRWSAKTMIDLGFFEPLDYLVVTATRP